MFLSKCLISCRNYINLFLGIIKWPVAAAMLLAAPAAVQSFRRYYVIRDQLNWHNLIYFAIGIGFLPLSGCFLLCGAEQRKLWNMK